MKNFIALTLIFYSTFFSIFESKINSQSKIDPDSTRTVTITFVGDLMCHSPQLEYAKVGKDSFDFKPMFSEVKKYLSNSDLTIGNLETTIAGKEAHYTGYPQFNSPEEYLDALKDTGFDILFTSNNHSFDRGKKGILKTIEKINEKKMIPIGTHISQSERDSVHIFEISGIKFSFLSYTYGLNVNYLPKNESFLVNVIDTLLIKHDILNARSKNADIVLVYFHFGDEYQRTPNKFQQAIVQQTISYGADIIIGSHPHVLQPIEKFVSDKNKIGNGLVAYSLGNFISNQRWRYSDAGAILNISVMKNLNTNEISLSGVNIIPTWVFKGKINGNNTFRIIPSDTTSNSLPEYLLQSDKTKLLQSFNDFQEIIKLPKDLQHQKLNEIHK